MTRRTVLVKLARPLSHVFPLEQNTKLRSRFCEVGLAPPANAADAQLPSRRYCNPVRMRSASFLTGVFSPPLNLAPSAERSAVVDRSPSVSFVMIELPFVLC